MQVARKVAVLPLGAGRFSNTTRSGRACSPQHNTSVMTLPTAVATPRDGLTPKPRHHTDLPTIIVLGSIGLAFIALGHDGRRIAQLFVLLLPALLWLRWPVQHPFLQRWRALLGWAWLMAFVLDGAARAYVLEAYRSAPEGSIVMSALANTNAREGGEYLSMHWRTLGLWAAAVLGSGMAAWRLLRASDSRVVGAPAARGWKLLMAALLCMCAVAYISSSWRRLHPAAFWTDWSRSVLAMRATWSDHKRLREASANRAKAVKPIVVRSGPSTVVLVITDSINRDNMSLYGYGRATTPRLQAQKRLLGDSMVIVRNAWSVDASTIPALQNLFFFGQPERRDAQHLIALAKAAGYKVWWMSNHDDLAIEQQHARLADEVEIINRTPGRAGASLDGELLDCLQEALEDPTEHKLIVLHLLGAHPHYSLRYPPGQNPFDDETDSVEAHLVRNGRSGLARRFRQEYDAAMVYHDFVVAETLQLTRTVPKAGGFRAWMYLSDHGQDGGHDDDKVGHSPHTAAGYRIPTVIWRSSDKAGTPEASVGDRPFRADWAGWTIADLLAMQWDGSLRNRNVLDSSYEWLEPTQLPFSVRSFTE